METKNGSTTFLGNMPFFFPETSSLSQVAGNTKRMDTDCTKHRWSSLSHSHAPPTVDEYFQEATPPPPSACVSFTDLARNEDMTHSYDGHPTSDQKNLVTTSAPILSPLTVAPGNAHYHTVPPHRWGARFIKQPPRQPPPPPPSTPPQRSHRTSHDNVHGSTTVFPKIARRRGLSDNGGGGGGRVHVVCMAMDEQNGHTLDHGSSSTTTTTKMTSSPPERAPDPLVSNLATHQFFYMDARRGRKMVDYSCNSNVIMKTRRPPALDYKRQAILKALVKRVDAMDKSNENCMPIFGLLGEHERRTIQRKMALSKSYRTMGSDEADAVVSRISSLTSPTSGGDNSYPVADDNFWIFTGKNRFSPLSGNLTGSLHRRISRINIPTNFMDVTLRYGNGVKLNGIFEAKGEHLLDKAFAGAPGGGDDDIRQSSQEKIQGYQRKLHIAEGIDLQDLLPYNRNDVKSLQSEDTIDASKTTNRFPTVRGNRRQKGERGDMMEPQRTSLPNLVKAGIVEQGSCPRDYDDSSFQLLRSRVIGVAGSSPGTRRKRTLISERQGHDLEPYEEQGVYKARVRNVTTQHMHEIDIIEKGDERRPDLDVTSRDKSYYDAAGIELETNYKWQDRYIPSDSLLNIDIQKRVKAIGQYEGTRKESFVGDTDVKISNPEVYVTSSVAIDTGSAPTAEHVQGQATHFGIQCADSKRVKSRTRERHRSTKDNNIVSTKSSEENNKYAFSKRIQMGTGASNVSDIEGRRTHSNGTSLKARKYYNLPKSISFKSGAILPPSKETIALAKPIYEFIDEEVQKTIRKYETAEGGDVNYCTQSESRFESEDSESQTSEEEVDPWQNEREERLFKRIKSKVLRMRKELPPSEPNKLCFISHVASCSHKDVQDEIEASGRVKVTLLQYDPVYLEEGTPDQYSSLWIFEITNDSDRINLLLKGFCLKGRSMNVRPLDDVTMEEHRAFQMYDAIRLEQRKKRLTRRFKRR